MRLILKLAKTYVGPVRWEGDVLSVEGLPAMVVVVSSITSKGPVINYTEGGP